MKLVLQCGIAAVVLGVVGCVTERPPARVTLERDTDFVRLISTTGEELVRYQVRKPMGSALTVESACYFHPLNTPSGVPVTDVAPLDHRHHRGIFFAWLEVHGKNDADFWGWGEHAPVKNRRIVNRAVEPLPGRGDGFSARNEWLSETTVLIREELQARVRPDPAGNVLDLTYTLTPLEDLKLSQWAFSGFCARAPKHPIEVTSSDGPVTLPPPNHMKPESDWPDRAWYAYTFSLPDGNKAGVAVYNHPSNPPTLWHNVTGIAMLNPCIVAPGPLDLNGGEALVLRYRVVAFDGPARPELLDQLASEFRK